MNITFTFYSKIALFTFHPYPDRSFRYGRQIALYNPKGLVSICFKVSPDQKLSFYLLWHIDFFYNKIKAKETLKQPKN